MNLLRNILIILSIALALAFGAFAYMGLFTEMTVKEAAHGPYHFVFQTQTGAFNQTPETIGAVEALLKEQQVTPASIAAIFYSDPALVPKEKWHSEAGCFLRRQDFDKIPGLPQSLEVREIPRKSYLVTRFPFKNQLSYMIGIAKAYPALEAYKKKHSLKTGYAMEIYRPEKIIYLMEVVDDRP